MKLSSGECQEKVRILVVDSNQTQCEVLAGALRRQRWFVVGTFSAAPHDCLAALQAFSTDVVLVGAGQETFDYLLDVVRTIHTSFSHARIILVLSSFDAEKVVSSLRAGARGLFCAATQPFKALCKCIHAVHQGQVWANTEQMGYVIEALKQASPVNVMTPLGKALLAPRENQVVALVVEGLSNRAISKQLSLAENSVKKSLLRIYDKLGISNRVELVLYALTQRGTTLDGNSDRALAMTLASVERVAASPRVPSAAKIEISGARRAS